MAVALRKVLLDNGNYSIVDDFTNIVVDDNFGEGFIDDNGLYEHMMFLESELRTWCYHHGVRVADFNYYDKVMYDGYMRDVDKIKAEQQRVHDEELRKMREAERKAKEQAERERQLREEKEREERLLREWECEQQMLREEELERQRQAERECIRREEEERQRIEYECKLQYHKDWLLNNSNLHEFFKLVRSKETEKVVLFDVILDHLRFCDDMNIEAGLLANILW